MKNSYLISKTKSAYRYIKNRVDPGIETNLYIVVEIKLRTVNLSGNDIQVPYSISYREIRMVYSDYYIGYKEYTADAPSYGNLGSGSTLQFWKQVRVLELPIIKLKTVGGKMIGGATWAMWKSKDNGQIYYSNLSTRLW
jgi:hypothetical protein